jgi:flagellar hook-basal body complex protein FliE
MAVDFSIAALNTRLPSFDAQAAGQARDIVAGAQTPGEHFTNSIVKAGENFVDTLSTAEAASIRGINGQANTYEVAAAVMEAEQALRMAVSVRDKIVSAYLEISRMQI